MGMETSTQASLFALHAASKESRERQRSVGSKVRSRCVRAEEQMQAADGIREKDDGYQPTELARGADTGTVQCEGSKQTATSDSRSVDENDAHQGCQLEAQGGSNKADVSVDDLLQLLHQQDHRCALTGRTLTPDNCAIDHIEPFSHGIENHTVQNLQLVVKEANKAKGVLSMPDFIQLCCDVAVRHGGRPPPA